MFIFGKQISLLYTCGRGDAASSVVYNFTVRISWFIGYEVGGNL